MEKMSEAYKQGLLMLLANNMHDQKYGIKKRNTHLG